MEVQSTSAALQEDQHHSNLSVEEKHQLRSKSMHLGNNEHRKSFIKKTSVITGSASNIHHSNLDATILDICYDAGDSKPVDHNIRSIRFMTAASQIDALIGSPVTRKHDAATPVTVICNQSPKIKHTTSIILPGDSSIAENVRLPVKNIRIRDHLEGDKTTQKIKRRLEFPDTEPVTPAANLSVSNEKRTLALEEEDDGELVVESETEKKKAVEDVSSHAVETEKHALSPKAEHIDMSKLTWSERSPQADESITSWSKKNYEQIDSEEEIQPEPTPLRGGSSTLLHEDTSSERKTRNLRDSFSLTMMRLRGSSSLQPENDTETGNTKQDEKSEDYKYIYYVPDDARYHGVLHPVEYAESQEWERELIDEFIEGVSENGSGRNLRRLKFSWVKMYRKFINLPFVKRGRAALTRMQSP